MTHYVLATQQPWGVKMLEQVMSVGVWHLVTHPVWLQPTIEAEAPRYVFCVNWSSRVPLDTLALAEVVNMHCTALPYGRGGGPIENLILRGHTETVITAHRMVEEVDAGPIYTTSGPVSLAGTKGQILDRFVEPVVALIRQIVETEPEPRPQVGEVVQFHRLPKHEMEALWKARS